MMQASTPAQPRYWIVGGEYRDTSFTEIVTGTETLSGPFTDYQQALCQWRRLARTTGGQACARFTIAQETVRQ